MGDLEYQLFLHFETKQLFSAKSTFIPKPLEALGLFYKVYNEDNLTISKIISKAFIDT